MFNRNTLFNMPFNANLDLFRFPVLDSAPHGARAFCATSVLVPIRSIGPSERERIEDHLLALSPQDRYLRFGYFANDQHIAMYVQGLDFERDEIFGIFNRKLELIAMAHLAFATEPELMSGAEFGVSVLPHARGRGYGARLFDRAIMHSRNEGVAMIFIHALSENATMLAIARKAGATLERDGVETEAYLKVPPADVGSHMSEMFNEQLAQADYRLKEQAKKFWSFLAALQDIRRGAGGGRNE